MRVSSTKLGEQWDTRRDIEQLVRRELVGGRVKFNLSEDLSLG